jgi:hypothetical protein
MGDPATAEGYVEVPGGRVWYQILGADRPGVPLLCLHGGPGMPHDYLEPLADLTAGRPVIFYDQLGGYFPAPNTNGRSRSSTGGMCAGKIPGQRAWSAPSPAWAPTST